MKTDAVIFDKSTYIKLIFETGNISGLFYYRQLKLKV